MGDSSSTAGGGPPDGLLKAIAGLAVAALAVVGLISRSHKCITCHRRFNWPPLSEKKLKLKCPECGSPLKGATADMIGDVGVCPKCKHEFTIGDP